MSESKKPNLKLLRSEWYAKIKEVDPDWKDIEDLDGKLTSYSGSVSLGSREVVDGSKFTSSNVDRGYTSGVEKEAQAEYYRLASQCLHTKTFTSEENKIIWKLHAAGVTIRAIAQRMGLSKGSIQYRIDRMKLKFFGTIK